MKVRSDEWLECSHGIPSLGCFFDHVALTGMCVSKPIVATIWRERRLRVEERRIDSAIRSWGCEVEDESS